jgi:hypothetical protein
MLLCSCGPSWLSPWGGAWIAFLKKKIYKLQILDPHKKIWWMKCSIFILARNIYNIYIYYVNLPANRFNGRLGIGRGWRAGQFGVDVGVDWHRAKNWVAAAAIVIEGLQLCSLGFVEAIPWPEPVGTGMRIPSLSIPASSLTPHVAAVVFFVAIGGAVFGRLLLELSRVQVTKFSKAAIFFALYIFLSVGFIPIVGALARTSLNCIDTRLDMDENDDDDGPACWGGTHIAYCAAACFTILLFFPFSVLAQPVWQERSSEGLSLRFHPLFLIHVACLKLVATVAPSFFPGDAATGAAASLGAAALAMAVPGLLHNQCTDAAWGRLRTAGHLAAAATSAASAWVLHSGARSYAPVAAVVAAWLVLIATAVTINIIAGKRRRARGGQQLPETASIHDSHPPIEPRV